MVPWWFEDSQGSGSELGEFEEIYSFSKWIAIFQTSFRKHSDHLSGRFLNCQTRRLGDRQTGLNVLLHCGCAIRWYLRPTMPEHSASQRLHFYYEVGITLETWSWKDCMFTIWISLPIFGATSRRQLFNGEQRTSCSLFSIIPTSLYSTTRKISHSFY